MIEFIVALIAIIALFVGLLQIGSLARAQSDTLVEARREAAAKALSMPGPIATAEYIAEIEAGPDGATYSVDDEFTDGDVTDFTVGLVDLSAGNPAAWTVLNSVTGNLVSAIHVSPMPTFEMMMVRGDDDATVPLISAVQKLIYDDTEIAIETEVWMPWIRGIY